MVAIRPSLERVLNSHQNSDSIYLANLVYESTGGVSALAARCTLRTTVDKHIQHEDTWTSFLAPHL